MIIREFANLFDFITKLNPSSIIILADTNTLQYCVPILIANVEILKDAQILEIEPGEESKSIEIATGLWETLMELNTDRNSLLLNVGGGVVCDLGGFVSVTFMRGISFINVPTTLLAMVDAGIGGKTGINLNQYKNLIGVFQEANANFYYPEFLITLPQNELRSGFAEVMKHYLIDSEASFYKLLQLNPLEIDDWEEIIKENIAIKSNFVDDDLKEKGKRAALNLGHTVAHALEAFFLKKETPIMHGDAVAAGILIESFISYSCEQRFMSKSDFLKIEDFIYSNFPKIKFGNEDISDIIQYMKHDKKNHNTEITFSLLIKPGECVLNYVADLSDVIKGLVHYSNHE
jgi:3-dehydroquinate synthase